MSLDPLTAAFDIGSKLIAHWFPDPAVAAEKELELFKLKQSGELSVITGQIDINKAEAGNPSVFVSGWRPFVGWVCGIGLAMQFLVSPLITWVALVFGKVIVLPPLDMSTLITMLGGLLGLGALRTVEKINEVARK